MGLDVLRLYLFCVVGVVDLEMLLALVTAPRKNMKKYRDYNYSKFSNLRYDTLHTNEASIYTTNKKKEARTRTISIQMKYLKQTVHSTKINLTVTSVYICFLT
jgi:hypothetical protein